MPRIVVGIYERDTMQPYINDLRKCDEQQRYEMERIEARYAQPTEPSQADRALFCAVRVFPEKYEPRDRPENPNRHEAMPIKNLKDGGERQFSNAPGRMSLPGSDRLEMTIMRNNDDACSKEPKNFQSGEFFRRIVGCRRHDMAS